MRILHVIPSMNPQDGGPVEGVLQLAAEWERMGHVTEVVSKDDPRDPWVTGSAVTIHGMGPNTKSLTVLGRRPPLAGYGYTPRLAPWLAANAGRYDGVIVNGLWNYLSLGAHRGLMQAGVPYHVFTHGMLDPWFKESMPLKHLAKQAFWLFADGPLLNDAAAVLFTTEEERELARNQFRPYRIREKVVGYGTADVEGDPERQVEAFLAAQPQLRGKRTLLFLSRIHPKKGCDLLVQAFGRIAAEHPDVDIVIAGPDQVGIKASLEALAREAGVADRIHWPGMLTGDAKWGAFRHAEAFILPSHQENFGVVVAEAMALSKPVLITNKVNIWREVEASGSGIVTTDDVDGAVALMRRFLALSSAERERMGAQARDTFLKCFHVTQFARNVLAVIREGLPRAADVA
ncbi:glycosyltransferase [Chthonobacter albigriseus]|uniref:glycosyltransferase n=1 Tax=Chthonobacter albigriseus TaxID=1683161 RepID=UPI0015EFBED9|nr:glycosyltransferase [Chthonobacter albigriseus]